MPRPISQSRQDSAGRSWLRTPQPRLGTAGLVALLVVANVIVPFSLDIYTPSVPQMLAGVLSAWFFAALFALFATVEATVRPYTTNILLSLRQSDVGSASSMINCVHTLFGVAGMALIMLPFPNYIVGLGVLMVASMTAAILAWAAACRRGLMREEG